MIKRRQLSITGQKGFTIIELLIATAVLSTILVLVTVVMVNIGSLYYKGINQSRVQDNVRSITDEVAQNIRFNSQPPTAPVTDPNNPNIHAYCIGAVRYTFVLGAQVGKPAPGTSTTYYHALWRDDNPTPGSCPTTINPSNPRSAQVDLTNPSLATADKINNGVELIADNSRLTAFSMTTGSPSTVAVSVAYGDNDLLCNPTGVAGSCATSDAMPNWTDYRGAILCKGGKGDQFCSTASLNTTVVQRL